MAVLSAAALLAFVAAATTATLTSAQSDWKYGRATFYGTDAWSIHKGSCGYGWLDYRIATGWDVAAISDEADDYQGSCGRCKEVKCKNFNFKDGYGEWLDRSSICYDESASVVVMITDTCPCVYPTNYYSNKRWCCGDMYHLDMSLWSYEKLADVKWGVIGVMWRDVPCWHRPAARARVPWWKFPTPMPWWERPPFGYRWTLDRRPQWGNWGRRLQMSV